MLLGTFNTPEIVLYPSPDLCLLTILSRRSTDVLHLGLSVCLLAQNFSVFLCNSLLDWIETKCIIPFPFPRTLPLHDSISSSMDSSLDFMVEFLLRRALSTVGPHIERCFFLNHVQLIELATGGVLQVGETSQG